MSELFREDNGVDGKCLVECNVLAPINFFDTLVDIVCRESLEVFDRFEDTDGGVQLEISAVHKLFIAHERYHSASNFYVTCAQLCQFFRQDRFEAHKGLGDQFKMLCHYV